MYHRLQLLYCSLAQSVGLACDADNNGSTKKKLRSLQYTWISQDSINLSVRQQTHYRFPASHSLESQRMERIQFILENLWSNFLASLFGDLQFFPHQTSPFVWLALVTERTANNWLLRVAASNSRRKKNPQLLRCRICPCSTPVSVMLVLMQLRECFINWSFFFNEQAQKWRFVSSKSLWEFAMKSVWRCYSLCMCMCLSSVSTRSSLKPQLQNLVCVARVVQSHFLRCL